MKATLLSLCFCFFLIQNGLAQDFHKVLVKAFGSQDSAAYYFKMAKKKIKTPADEAEFYLKFVITERDLILKIPTLVMVLPT